MKLDDIMRFALKADPLGSDGRLWHMACVAPRTLEQFASLIAEDCATRCDAIAAAYDASGEYPDACGADACAVEIREAYKP